MCSLHVCLCGFVYKCGCVGSCVRAFDKGENPFVSRAVVVGVCIVVNNYTGCHSNRPGISPLSSPL